MNFFLIEENVINFIQDALYYNLVRSTGCALTDEVAVVDPPLFQLGVVPPVVLGGVVVGRGRRAAGQQGAGRAGLGAGRRRGRRVQ